MFLGMSYVNGEYLPHRADFSKRNPSTGEELGIFPTAGIGVVDSAVGAARQAFKWWRKISRVKRAEYFDGLCQVLKENQSRVVRAISEETGKTVNEAVAEFNEALHMAQYTFGMGRLPVGQILPSEIADKDSYCIRKPKGVVAVIAPWNFPFAIGGFWCACPAILEGNTVVLKPSEDAPKLGQLTAEMFQLAGFPAGVFNMIHGEGYTGDLLAKHEDVNHICFTGSAAVGQLIQKVCANSFHGKSCSCEMGSKSAMIICNDCDLNMAVDACVASAYKLSGQRCVSAGRILVHSALMDRFLFAFLSRSQKLRVGDPLAEDIDMGPIISESQRESVEDFNRQSLENEFTQVILSGERLDRPGYFLTPHVYTTKWHVQEKRPFLVKEAFGPHVAIVPFDDDEEAIAIYNDTPYGLSLGVCTSDYRRARKYQQECDFGLGYFNLPCIGAESQVPFGGVKRSGNGQPSAAGTFDAVVHKITWTVNNACDGFQMAQGLK